MYLSRHPGQTEFATQERGVHVYLKARKFCAVIQLAVWAAPVYPGHGSLDSWRCVWVEKGVTRNSGICAQIRLKCMGIGKTVFESAGGGSVSSSTPRCLCARRNERAG